MKTQENTDLFLERIEQKLAGAYQNKVPFSRFLEEKMDWFDYSNTALAKKVFHRVEKKGEDAARYVPVTRQTIGAWLKGSMPSSREIYITLGMAFEMGLEEINYVLLETYMGYGLYCKNIEDALWIALINGLFSIHEMEQVKAHIEELLDGPEQEEERSLATMDLWVMLSEARSLEQFYDLVQAYKEEFRDGAKRFGQCLEEVIEEEYGYYDKAAWMLRDIGLLHYEAQFSKIKAGKAVVTREWLLRFCIALQPGISSIEKLLAKAQMEPLGITPAEIIIEMIAKYKADTVADSQKIWMMIESAATALGKRGYELEEDLCRKYDSVYNLPFAQKLWFSICVGQQLLENQKKKDYGYEKNGYCRYIMTDRVLFDDVNRNKKNSQFKKDALKLTSHKKPDSLPSCQEVPSLSIERGFQPDVFDLEKFEDYCYMRRPSRFSKDFVRNDLYYYCALLYSIWCGKCFQKEKVKAEVEELREEWEREGICSQELIGMLSHNLTEGTAYEEDCDIVHIVEAFCACGKSE
ncbi:MAG: hypothetical protein Q4D60_04900 [Eubacteriales bacterium]|nr:hypothetical protein [Eubacteriales bacterium]